MYDSDDEAPVVLLAVSNNQGYGPDQVEGSMTLGALRDALEEAINTYGEDAMIVTKESGNRYGARYGAVDIYADTFTGVDEEDED
jgi:hypothetical protein